MRIVIVERVLRLARRPVGLQPLPLIEGALLVGLAAAVANLVWTVATPVAPLGDWQPRQPVALPPSARLALFTQFDPFFRGEPAGDSTQAVTTLSLRLTGVRVNEATGLGSAIIATPDDVQTSFAVGDEITAGATLKAVAVDHVVIDRNGRDELLYIDQSTPAPTASPTSAPVSQTATLPPAPPTAAAMSAAAAAAAAGNAAPGNQQ